MTEQKNNMVILFSKEALVVLYDIKKKHKLEESHEEILKKLQGNKVSKINILVNLTRDLMTEKVSNKEFFDALHKELEISAETTKNLAIDIMHNLIPLLEKIPEDQLEEYNRKKTELERESENPEEEVAPGKKEGGEEVKKEEFKKAKEELFGKLRATVKIEEPEPEKTAAPNLKSVPIVDVEKNAKTIRHAQQRPGEVAAVVEEAAAPKEKVKPDPYKEPVE